MSTIAAFFATRFWGSRWGVVDAFHRTPHKGLDVVHAGRTPVPALRSGRVVADLPSPSVGRYIVVEVAPNDYDVYCHVVTRGLKGWISAGATLCYLAGYGDPHGSAWTGPHCHVCRSTTRTGWAYWGPQNRNPEILIRALLSSSGVGVSVEKKTNLRGDEDMYIIGCSTRKKDDRYALILPYGHQPMTDLAYAEEKRIVPALNVTQADWDRHIARAEARRALLGSSVPDVDEAALVKALGPALASVVQQLRATVPGATVAALGAKLGS